MYFSGKYDVYFDLLVACRTYILLSRKKCLETNPHIQVRHSFRLLVNHISLESYVCESEVNRFHGDYSKHRNFSCSAQWCLNIHVKGSYLSSNYCVTSTHDSLLFQLYRQEGNAEDMNTPKPMIQSLTENEVFKKTPHVYSMRKSIVHDF